MRRGLSVVIVLSITLTGFGCPFRVPNPNAQSYDVEITGLVVVEPEADSLNDFDAAAGGAFPRIGQLSPAVWQDGELRFLATNLGIGILYGINNRGAAVGVQLHTAPGTFFHFVSYTDAEGPLPEPVVDGTLFSVNEFNEYVGTAGPDAALGFVFSEDMFLFGGEDKAVAYDINDLGDFVGSTFDSSGPVRTAVKWLRGVRTPLDSFGGTHSEAYAINNHGVAVGVSTDPPAVKTTEPHQAVCWMGTEIIALPTLGGTESTAWDINDRGEAVGFSLDENEESRAALWRNIGNGSPSIVNLDDVTDFGDDAGSLILREAIDINEPGTILCRADKTDGAMTETVYLLLRP